jgi:hypothetical protein
MEAIMKRWRSLLIVAGLIACPTFAEALQAIPEACRIENCRRHAREANLHGLKRYRFIRDCRKKIRFVCYGNL